MIFVMFNIPQIQRTNFKKHFIKQAFIEIRFAAREIDWKALEAFYKSNINDKANVRFGMKAQFKFTNENDAMKVSSEGEHKRESTHFSNADGTFGAEVFENRIVFFITKYDSFDSFCDSSLATFAELNKFLKIEKIVRLGIRKINELGIIDSGYNGAGTNEMIFTPLKNNKFDSLAVKSAATKYVLEKDNVRAIVTVNASKSTSDGHILVIDLDMQNTLNFELKNADIKSELKSLNDRIFAVYTWIISDDLRNELQS
ncbi:MAG: TIGR04255 family protein [Pseudobdellovibrio sp.]|nr:TIGR04255 family protein [Pseudobdellovibrio sp.]